MAPSVSVCVPVYNGAKYLAECLESVLSQTYRDLEIIVVDDGSTDESPAIASRYALMDKRIRLIHNQRNLGLVGNWNHCIALAQGDWLKFVFQDDLIQPRCLSRMIQAATSEVDIVAVKRDIIFEAGTAESVKEFYRSYLAEHSFERHFPSTSYVSPLEFSELLLRVPHGNCIGEPTCVLIRRSAFEKYGYFDTDLVSLCDWECCARVAANSGICYIKESLAYFRVHAKSRSAEIRNHWNYCATTIDDLIIQYRLVEHPAFSVVRNVAKAQKPPVLLKTKLVRAITHARWEAASRADGGRAMREWWWLIIKHPRMLLYCLEQGMSAKLAGLRV